jgi:hypothetical protein
MRIAKYILGYILGVGFFFYIFFFFGQFPYDRLKEGLIQSFEDSVPLSLSIGRIAPSFPLSLGMERIRVGSEGFSLQLPDLIVHPNLGQILLGNPSFEFSDSTSWRFKLPSEKDPTSGSKRAEKPLSNGKGRTSTGGGGSFGVCWRGKSFRKAQPLKFPCPWFCSIPCGRRSKSKTGSPG